jgi:hypothetical protein
MARQQTQPPRRRLASLMVAALLGISAISPNQGSAQDPNPRKPIPFPNSFGRFVKPPTPRILESGPPRETSGLGGFFMPMKSFTNPFRNLTRSASNGIGSQSSNPPRLTPREPFSDSTADNPAADSPAADSPAADSPAADSSASTFQRPPNVPPIQRADRSTVPLGVRSGGIGSTDPESESESLTEPKTYIANPKFENLDAVGTSRRSKNPTVRKQTTSASKNTPSPENDSEVSSRSSRAAQAVEAKISATSLSRPSDTERSDTGLSASIPTRSDASTSDELGPPLSRSAKRSPEKNSSARKPSSVRSELASNNNAPNRQKNLSVSSVGLDVHSPGLNLVMTGPDSILVGRAAPYELVATNEGGTPLHGLTVRLFVPANVTIEDPTASDGVARSVSEELGTGVVWEIGQLPANESRSLKISVRTEQPEHFAMSLDWKIENPFIQIPIRVQQPQLILALEGASEADYGQPQVYRLRVRNPGNATAEAVRILLQAEPNGSSEEILGDIPPGTERVVEVELTFQHAGKATVSAKAISDSANLEATRNIDVEVRQSELLATWNGPAEFYEGNVGDYSLTIENRGSIESMDNTFSVTIPAGIGVVRLPSGVSQTENQLLWEVPRIAVGETLEWKFQFAMNKSGNLSFTVDAGSSTGEPTQATLETRVDAVADLSLSVNDPISPAPVGQPVVYQIKISNRGKKVAEDVFVIAQFSDGIEPTRIEGHAGKLVPGQALFDNIPKIEPGEELVLTVTAQASKPGSHRFRAAVRCQGSEDDLLKEESTRYTASGGATSQSK